MTVHASVASTRMFLLSLVVVLFLSACSSSAGTTPTIANLPTPSMWPIQVTPTAKADAFSDLPDEARVATRQGDPRPPAYWALWNTCAEGNRSEEAAAQGGRAAGFILMDDLIAKPGIQLGDYQVMTCEEGLSLLQRRTAAGKTTDDPAYSLASVLLAAELNLNVGGESCPIAEEAVLGGHLILSGISFNGSGEYAENLSAEFANAIPRLVELLDGYNRGELCR